MDITSIDVLIPSPVSPGSQLALMLLRLFVGERA